MDSKKSIFMLVDGSAIVHRAYHAMPPFTTSSGVPTGAVHGFFSMFLKLIHELKPAHIVVAFDRPKPTFRQELYVGYQAQRPKMESDLSEQYQAIIDILRKAKIQEFAVDGYEADDIIGTLSEKAKDMGNKKKVLMPVKGISEVKVFDEGEVLTKYNVEPREIVDLKALTGDPSDNYPGVSGIGPKTAATLVRHYGNVDNIYKHLDEIAIKNKALAQKLIDGAESAQIGKTLAKIVTDVPFVCDFADCLTSKIDIGEFKKALESYEFKTLPRRVDEIFNQKQEIKKENQMKLL